MYGFSAEKTQVTPESYGSAISEFSTLPTGEGEIHVGLAEFLNSEQFTVNLGGSSRTQAENSCEQPFLTLYNLGHCQPENSRSRVLPPRPQDFRTPDEFLKLPLGSDAKPRAQVLFLRGYPSPRWLKVIGSKYELEPDFPAQHLGFLNPNVQEDMPTVGIPTSVANVIQLWITTVGSYDRDDRTCEQHEIDALRQQGRVDMALYLDKLHKGRFNVGNAMVRDYFTLDKTLFAIEQKVSIHIQTKGKSWFAFVWLDSGNSLDDSVKGPWSHNPDQTRLHPIIMYRSMDALSPAILESTKSLFQNRPGPSKQPQTAALLVHRYGSLLHPERLDRGVIYALYQVFSIAAYSESQFLVQVDLRLRKTLGYVNRGRFDGFTDLAFIRELLYRHIQQINMGLLGLKNFRSLDVSTKPGSKATKASEAEVEAGTTTAWIIHDFNHNLEYARALDKQCQEGIAILMSSASIAESKKAMVQQERIEKLTFLAFIFVPLAFTTSFFGMNVKELGEKVNSVWHWALMSVVIIVVAQVAFFFTADQLKAQFRRRKD